MPSNRVVTYIDIKLNSVEEYWSELVVPNVREFRREPSPPSLFNAALAIWHLHDWVWHDRNPGQDSRGAAFNTYRNDLLTACPELGWLRDIADAGKHRGLGRLPEVKGAEPREIHGVLTPMIPLTQTIKGHFFVLNDGTIQRVDTVLNAAIQFSQTQLPGRLPPP
jgi:hypothetical protein